MSDRPQDLHEEVANSALHGAALVGACLAVPQLLGSAPAAQPEAAWGVLVFSATMALLYGASTLYHALPPGWAKQWALRLDHAAIHLFIAGSFTPFALNAPGDAHPVTALALVWLAALAGCRRAVVIEQNHGGQLYRYLRAECDFELTLSSCAVPGPVPLDPQFIADHVAGLE